MPQLLVIRPAEKTKVFNRFPKDNKNSVDVSIKRTTIGGGGGDGDASGIVIVTNKQSKAKQENDQTTLNTNGR